MKDESIKSRFAPNMSFSRFKHTFGVIQTATHLAEVFGADVKKAECAAFLHDCAKNMEPNDMIALAEEEGFAPDEFELNAPAILHAPAGAALARRGFGITDPEILNAIRCHTIGCINPTKLDAIIFVADFIEPYRKPFDGLDKARALSETDLLSAMKECARLSGEYVLSQGGQMHPTTIKMINDTEDLI